MHVTDGNWPEVVEELVVACRVVLTEAVAGGGGGGGGAHRVRHLARPHVLPRLARHPGGHAGGPVRGRRPDMERHPVDTQVLQRAPVAGGRLLGGAAASSRRRQPPDVQPLGVERAGGGERRLARQHAVDAQSERRVAARQPQEVAPAVIEPAAGRHRRRLAVAEPHGGGHASRRQRHRDVGGRRRAGRRTEVVEEAGLRARPEEEGDVGDVAQAGARRRGHDEHRAAVLAPVPERHRRQRCNRRRPSR